MAIIIRGKTKCPLCSQIIAEEDTIVSTSHFIGDTSDPLWRFSDAVMHVACFQNWHQREVFIERFNAIVGNFTFGNGTYHHMQEDGSISVLKRAQPQ